ncbi:hypothetical protein [Numidum massiliense]|uniref:hypothetical protein n=1 Tax=Numidum massiliense TaxID=1522315 RepID=UPI0006D593DA|nr:hypothetical protein [Numidum massiliense]
MSAFKRFFSGVTDTGDKVRDKRFRTRYYRAERKKVCSELAKFFQREKDIELVHESLERGEIMIEYRNGIGMTHDLVVTVLPVTPVQASVDMHAAVRSRFFDFGTNGKMITRIYRFLDKQFTTVE